VHPSKGEGFGLVPFQSIACETPVIAPHATGMADYLDNENSICLNTSGRTAGEGVGNAVGTYFTIDEDHLVDRLRYVEANWEIEYEKVKQASASYRQSYQWPVVLNEFTELISAIIKEEDIDQIRAKHLSCYQA
jgi:glycosyltransferase involved in cell wall biosynthesis